MKNRYLMRRCIAIVFSLVCSFFIISMGTILAYNATNGPTENGAIQNHLPNPNNSIEVVDDDVIDTSPQEPITMPEPDITNILILGLDASNGPALTDTILLMSFDGHTNMVDVISIPRDTRVLPTEVDQEDARSIGRHLLPGAPIKINEMHSMMGRDNGYRFVQRHVGAILGVEVDYYVLIDLEAFRVLVDSIGGVYINVRPQGHHYVDIYQNPPLVINIEGGLQLLNGERAEQFVRYRGPRGDLGRIENQQLFMNEFFSQAMSMDNIVSLGVGIIRSMFQHVSTDFNPLTEMGLVMGALQNLNPESIDFHTLPGDARNGIHAFNHTTDFFWVDYAEAIGMMERIRLDNMSR